MKKEKKEINKTPMTTKTGGKDDKSPSTIKEPPYHDLPIDLTGPVRG
ncbi:MAG: hypothetical protein ACOY40_01100 [Bacillota bacterium]